jgi:hypothetical protein
MVLFCRRRENPVRRRNQHSMFSALRVKTLDSRKFTRNGTVM